MTAKRWHAMREALAADADAPLDLDLKFEVAVARLKGDQPAVSPRKQHRQAGAGWHLRCSIFSGQNIERSGG